MAGIEIDQDAINLAQAQEQNAFSNNTNEYLNKRVVELAALCNAYRGLLVSHGIMDDEGNLVKKRITRQPADRKQKEKD